MVYVYRRKKLCKVYDDVRFVGHDLSSLLKVNKGKNMLLVTEQ